MIDTLYDEKFETIFNNLHNPNLIKTLISLFEIYPLNNIVHNKLFSLLKKIVENICLKNQIENIALLKNNIYEIIIKNSNSDKKSKVTWIFFIFKIIKQLFDKFDMIESPKSEFLKNWTLSKSENFNNPLFIINKDEVSENNEMLRNFEIKNSFIEKFMNNKNLKILNGENNCDNAVEEFVLNIDDTLIDNSDGAEPDQFFEVNNLIVNTEDINVNIDNWESNSYEGVQEQESDNEEINRSF